MTALPPTPSADGDGPSSVTLAELVEEVTRRARAGEAMDLDALRRDHPRHAAELSLLLPVLRGLAGLREGPAAGPLGEFRIVREVGRGGMGVVYEAVQESLGRRVALKVRPPVATLSPEHRERFRREAHAAARLHHTHIVPVFGVGERDGVLFYAMQFIEGVGLDALVRDGEGGPTEWAARVAADVADALDHAHRQGVLHRDVKPSNILIDRDGSAWLTDFGLAHVADADGLTHTGDVIGTPRYLPPEGFGGRCDARGDVYGLGLTLYELLARRPAFDAPDRAALVERITHDGPAPLRRLAPGLPRDLETVVHKAVDREPGRRYQTAAEFADDLRRFLADRPVRARPAGPLRRLWRWAKRRPVVAALSAMLVLAGLALLSLGGWSYGQIDAALAVANRKREDEEKARHRAESEAYRALFSETQALRFGRRPGWRGRALANLAALARSDVPERDLAALRQEAVLCLAEADAVAAADFSFDESVFGLAVSDDGALLGVRTSDLVEVLDAASRESRGRFPTPSCTKGEAPVPELRGGASPLLPLAFSPDGSLLAFLVTPPTGGVEIRQLAGTSTPAPKIDRRQPAYDVTWDGAGRLLAVPWRGRQVGLYDAATGAERGTVAYGMGTNRWVVAPVALSPGGDLLAVVSPSGGPVVELHSVDAAGVKRKAEVQADRPGGSVRSLAFSPDGRFLAVATGSEAAVWDLSRVKSPAFTLTGHAGGVNWVKFSPDGDRIATADEEGVRLWDAGTGRLRLFVPSEVGAVAFLAFTRGGARLLVGGEHRVKLYDLPPERPAARVLLPEPGVASWRADAWAVHPHRLAVAVSSTQLRLQVIDATDAGPPRRQTLSNKGSRALAFSPDGRLLAGLPPYYEKVDLCNVWDPASGRQLSSVPLPKGLVDAIPVPAFDPSGRRLAVACSLRGPDDGRPTVAVLDLEGERLLWSAAEHSPALAGAAIRRLWFEADGGRLAALVGADRLVRWDAATGRREEQTLPVSGGHWHAHALGGDGLLVRFRDGPTHSFALPAGDLRVSVPDGDSHVVAMALSPDGRVAATAHEDHRIRLFGARDGRPLLTLPPRLADVRRLEFARDAEHLVVNDESGALTLLDLTGLRADLAALGLDVEPAPRTH